MTTSCLNAALINHSFGDPGLIVQFRNKKRAILFDLGNLSSLPVSQVLNITHVFVTHTHIDHFFGFDQMLRLCLGRNKVLHLYGPPGFSQNTKGKLSGYHWNLVSKYEQNLTIHTIEVHESHTITQSYQSKNQFEPSQIKQLSIKNGIILSEKNFVVTAITLDHGTPCLGFSLQEQPQIKILSEKISSMGLLPGRWIKHFKHCLSSNQNKKTLIQIPNNCSETLTFNLQNLKKKIAHISPGYKITYITDVGFTNKNKAAMLKLAHRSTHLFIEATFTMEQKEMAASKYHLTAKQAGQIARMSKSEKYTLFHHSNRYTHNPDLLKQEAELAFRGDV